jgi:HEPN domain-containing protein
MTVEDQIQYWLHAAEHDLPVAESLFSTAKFDWCLFIGHLVLEKTLKAHVVKATQLTPPKTHDLLRLASITSIAFKEEQLKFLETANAFNLEARYPDEKFSFSQLCTREFTERNFTLLKEMYQWLLSLLK